MCFAFVASFTVFFIPAAMVGVVDIEIIVAGNGDFNVSK